jgi:hypothetical protein
MNGGKPYVIISSDGHVAPKIEEHLSPYVEAKHKQAFKDYLAKPHGYEGNPVMLPDDYLAVFAEYGNNPAYYDSHARDKQLDEQGICGEVLYIGGQLWESLPFADRPFSPNQDVYADKSNMELVAAGVRIYNRWLADFCAASPGRRAGVALVPMDDIDLCVAEIEWAAKNGLRGGVMPFFCDMHHPDYNDPIYARVWAAAADHDMPLSIHAGNDPSPKYGSGPEAIALFLHELSIWSRRSMWFMMYSGVFDRHPNLKVVFTEQLADWVPQTLVSSMRLRTRI